MKQTRRGGVRTTSACRTPSPPSLTCLALSSALRVRRVTTSALRSSIRDSARASSTFPPSLTQRARHGHKHRRPRLISP